MRMVRFRGMHGQRNCLYLKRCDYDHIHNLKIVVLMWQSDLVRPVVRPGNETTGHRPQIQRVDVWID